MNENRHQAGKENYTPNWHTQNLLIFYRSHSKLFHTYFTKRNVTLILQKKMREIFYDDFGVYLSSGFLWFIFFFFACSLVEGASSFYRSLESSVEEEIRIQLADKFEDRQRRFFFSITCYN